MWHHKRANGGAQWAFHSQFWGHQREMELGSFRLVSLAKALKTADRARQKAQSEIDPVEQRRLQRQQSTPRDGRLESLACEGFEKHKASFRTHPVRADY